MEFVEDNWQMEKQISPGSETPTSAHACRLLVRKERSLAEIWQFVVSGLEIGQQVVALGGPACLKELAHGLSDHGLRPEALLRSGRLVFLTAPDCLSQFAKGRDPFERGPLRRNSSMLRWVSDWSWAYGNGASASTILDHQKRVHGFIRALTPLSLCTVHCENLGRSSLLAMLADHRRALKVAHQA